MYCTVYLNNGRREIFFGKLSIKLFAPVLFCYSFNITGRVVSENSQIRSNFMVMLYINVIYC